MNRRDELTEARAGRLNADEHALYEAFKRLGMPPTSALGATAGHDGHLSSTDPVDGLIEVFERQQLASGKPPDQARRLAEGMAAGRGTLYELRETLKTPITESGASPATDFNSRLAAVEAEARRSAAIAQRITEQTRPARSSSKLLEESTAHAFRGSTSTLMQESWLSAFEHAGWSEGKLRKLKALLSEGVDLREAIERVEQEKVV